MEKYTNDVVGQGVGTCRTIMIESGAVIEIARVNGELPKNVGEFNHRIYSNGTNGKETLLEFSLSKEACIAILQLYTDHGLINDNNKE